MTSVEHEQTQLDQPVEVDTLYAIGAMELLMATYGQEAVPPIVGGEISHFSHQMASDKVQRMYDVFSEIQEELDPAGILVLSKFIDIDDVSHSALVAGYSPTAAQQQAAVEEGDDYLWRELMSGDHDSTLEPVYDILNGEVVDPLVADYSKEIPEDSIATDFQLIRGSLLIPILAELHAHGRSERAAGFDYPNFDGSEE